MAVREVIAQEIDWPCQVRHRFSDKNQGCRLGVSGAISWFFEEVPEGIILEDDCVPHPDFFRYSAVLLDRYRQDTRIWCITGNNFQDGVWRGEGSYYFSRYPHCWGWASWRRCWQHYDGDMTRWTKLRDSGLLNTIFEDAVERQYFANVWQRLLDEGRPDSWAYRWTLTCLLNGGLTATPNRNLVENIGFGEDATHTTDASASHPVSDGLAHLSHPSFLLRDSIADRHVFDHHFGGVMLRKTRVGRWYAHQASQWKTRFRKVVMDPGYYLNKAVHR
jgi:hypothetical protein